jgi:choline dehydrogenase-like flavoprotein
MSDYDVIIIGTGAGGGTLARHLAPSGKKILLLERGGWLAREPQNWSTADVFVDGRYISPDTWYDAKGKTFQPQVHYFVGGATKLYGAALYRLREKDFGELKYPDGVSPAWPIGYDDMEPYYTMAEGHYQVRGALERPLPLPGAPARAPDPATVGRSRRRRPPSVPRAMRCASGRGHPTDEHLRPLRQLRRLPVPAAREGRRRGDGRSPGARIAERHTAH